MTTPMRRALRLVAAGLLVLPFAAASARALPYTGALELNFGLVAPITGSGAGDGASAPDAVAIGPGANLTTTLSRVTPAAFPIVEFLLTGPGGLTAAGFAAGAGPGGGLGGDAPLTGSARIGWFGPPPFTFVTLPLSVIGVEGATAMASSDLGVAMTVFAGAWTTGTAEVIGTTFIFEGEVLAQGIGTDTRTAGGAGTIVLVSPALIRTNVAFSDNIPMITTLTLNFVPEPGTATLLAAGLGGLAALGRRRSGRAQPRR